VLARALSAMQWEPFVRWSFGHYLEIAPPSLAGPLPPRRSGRPVELAAA